MVTPTPSDRTAHREKRADYFEKLLRRGKTGTKAVASVAQLNKKVDEVRLKQAIVESNKVPPIVEKPKKFTTFAATYTAGTIVRKGLERLDQDYILQKIKGDGHCFFRATAVFIVKKWVTSSAVQRMEYLEGVRANIEGLKSEALTEKFGRVEKLLKAVAMEEFSHFSAVYNETISNLLVHFLRELACECNKQGLKEGQETFSVYVQERTGKDDVNAYLTSMSDMQRAMYADEPELMAIVKMMRINIRVLNITSIGAGQEILQRHLRHCYDESQPERSDLFLVRRNNHYDIALKKKGG